MISKIEKRKRRTKKVRKRILRTSNLPRLSVFRSSKYIYAQIIDDRQGKTLVSATEKELTDKQGTKTDRAERLGLILANKAKVLGIKKVVFDRNGYLYHGRVKALAQGARKGGLNF